MRRPASFALTALVLGGLAVPGSASTGRPARVLQGSDPSVTAVFPSDRFAGAETRSLRTLKRGEGKVLERGGERVAAYRDVNGAVIMRSATCTHMDAAWILELSLNVASTAIAAPLALTISP